MKTTTTTDGQPTVTWVLETQFKDLTDEEVHKIWASENGLEDMDMCKYADFLVTFRFVEKAILRKEQEK